MDIFNFAENKSVTQCPNQMIIINVSLLVCIYWPNISLLDVICDGECLSCKIHKFRKSYIIFITCTTINNPNHEDKILGFILLSEKQANG